MKYNAEAGIYHGTENIVITLPEGFELITGGTNDIGNGLHHGFSHYLGCTTLDYYESHKNEFDSYRFRFEFFGPLVFISLHDIKFNEPYPYVITADEFNKKWEFNKYIIARWSHDLRLVNMRRIKVINSEFDIECLLVTNRDFLDQDSMIRLEIEEGIELSRITTSFKSYIIIDCNDEIFDTYSHLINQVNKEFDREDASPKVDIDYPRKLWINYKMDHVMAEIDDGTYWDKLFKEIDEYIHFRKIKYIE